MALRRADKYLTCENRSHALALQCKVKARMKEEGAVTTPALRKPDNSIALDNREKAVCLAGSIEQQYSENPSFDVEHVRRVEEEVRHRVSFPPKDDLDPITLDEVSKHIKGLKIRKVPGIQLTLFADDTALNLRSNSIGNMIPRLQRAIDELTQWLRLWRIDADPEKSASIYFNYSPYKVQFLACHDLREFSFCSCKADALYELQKVQNKFCRRAADAPWYVKNSVLHRDLELPTISKFMKDASERFFDIVSSHLNPLLVLAVLYEPPLPHHFCRRPRNVLIDPPGDLTIEEEKLLELNKMIRGRNFPSNYDI
ncbi:hypothetical protein EVAR_38845_1 [Eumeta japonica]|uniref:Uncharacterized protein n=1 Tax=Eumeta variegata TaxID=151549 RepID=A0A4C1XNJ8_EUMVA|nr:hypothetical protein EVAR_38845_1 [Eumeta japonica]